MEHTLRFLRLYTGGVLFLNSSGSLCVSNTQWIINPGGEFHHRRFAARSRAHQGDFEEDARGRSAEPNELQRMDIFSDSGS